MVGATKEQAASKFGKSLELRRLEILANSLNLRQLLQNEVFVVRDDSRGHFRTM